MDDKNQFLSSYKKKIDARQDGQQQAVQTSEGAPASLHFEEKSEFVQSRPSEGTGQGRRMLHPKAALYVSIGIVVVILAIIGLFWYFSSGIEVIDLTDWTVTDAQLWARDNNIQLQIEEQYNDQFDESKVISQNQAKGTTVKKGSFIKILVSLGHDLTIDLDLPDLMAMTKAEVEAWASKNFMTKVRITAEYSNEIAAGQVIRFEINDNTVVDKVKRNTPVYVIVSKGKESQVVVQITVPNFKEKTVAQSYVFATENGLSLIVVEQYDDYAPNGTITAQSVKAEEKVNKGTEITITVSKGKKIVLPDFSGYSKQKAAAVAAELGVTLSSIEKYSSQPAGVFLSQSLTAGSVYTSGDLLELAYSLGNQTVLSSFVGQTRDAIETWARGLNSQGAAITISTTYTQSNSPKDIILYQDKTNTVIGITTTIRITVSRGKAVFIPDFIAPEGAGYDTAITREKALALCEDLKLVPVFVAANQAGRLPGEIWYQSIAAGKEAYEGATITLKYCPVNEAVIVRDFSGLSKTEIIDAGYLRVHNIIFLLADTPKAGYAGLVYQQSLPAGSIVAAGSTITLTVSP